MSSIIKEAYDIIKGLVQQVDEKNDTIVREESTETGQTKTAQKTSEPIDEARLEEIVDKAVGSDMNDAEEKVEQEVEELNEMSGAGPLAEAVEGSTSDYSSSDDEDSSDEGSTAFDRLKKVISDFFESELASGTSEEELDAAIEQLAAEEEETSSSTSDEDMKDDNDEEEEASSSGGSEEGLVEKQYAAEAPPWLKNEEEEEVDDAEEDEESGEPVAEEGESEEEEEPSDEETEEDESEEGEEEEEAEEEEPSDEETEEDESEEGEEEYSGEGTPKKAGLRITETEKLAAVLYHDGSSPADTLEWVVFDKEAGNAPILRVCGKDAFGESFYDTPGEDEYPERYSSYGEAFMSEDYGRVLLNSIEQDGLQKVCELVNGKIVKQGQIGVSPTTGGPTAMQERQPAGTTVPPAPLDAQNTPSEGGGDTNLNPSDPEMGKNKAPKVSVIEYILTNLAVQVANGVYTPQDVIQELKSTFTDEEASAQFMGALMERADNIAGDESGVSEQPGINQFNGPQVGSAQEMAPKTAELIEELNELKTKLASYEKEAVIRAKIASAVSFIRNEMQTRGANGKPLMPSVDYLVMTGMTKEAAVEKERELTYKKAEELIFLDDNAWKALYDTVMEVPPLNNDSAPSGFMPKKASVDGDASGSKSLPIFMANDNSVSAEDIDDSLFESNLTRIAREHNSMRAKRKQRIH